MAAAGNFHGSVLFGVPVEVEADKRSQVQLEVQQLEADGDHAAAVRKMKGIPNRVRDALRRHYWIRHESDDPTGLLSRHLDRRGVQAVTINNWQKDLSNLLSQCFSSPFA